MDDIPIVRLYWDSREKDLYMAADKYGNDCATIARNMLGNTGDAEECVNDTGLQLGHE